MIRMIFVGRRLDDCVWYWEGSAWYAVPSHFEWRNQYAWYVPGDLYEAYGSVDRERGRVLWYNVMTLKRVGTSECCYCSPVLHRENM